MLDVITPELAAYHQKRLAQFRLENTKLSPQGIVFVGDSITEFFPIKKYLGRDLPLINRGIAGMDTSWLLSHLDEQVVALEPRQIILMIGVNDIGMGFSISDIVERMAELLGQLRMTCFGAEILLLSVLPVNEAQAYAKTVKIRSNALITELNKSLKGLSGIEFINLYPEFLDETGQLAVPYTTDGLHLTPKAYEKLAHLLTPYLENMV
ncbi:SGNH/GDSL hydrolase family protein [Streptococcus plurextorum]|uniref:SGNH/GDSL hydrolase family protein n=1 Tax=Streptococcus plurextorum TaxID=456876 RepID=UPI00040F18E8|nr:SGNH/GDSL hydrolase family protein [Streptococcus plurextorum]